MRRVPHAVLLLLFTLALGVGCGSPRKKGVLCNLPSDCEVGLCLAGECTVLASCSSQSECTDGLCRDGTCWNVPCETTANCRYGTCIEGYCVAQLSSVVPDAVDDGSGEETSSPDLLSGDSANVDGESPDALPDTRVCVPGHVSCSGNKLRTCKAGATAGTRSSVSPAATAR